MGLYLALGGGPPSFTPGFSCLALLGNMSGRRVSFVYGAITLCGSAFQKLQLEIRFMTPCQPVHWLDRPTTPRTHKPHRPLGVLRFRLVPVRSPLLRESRLLSFPPGTEMFQFPGFALLPYAFRQE